MKLFPRKLLSCDVQAVVMMHAVQLCLYMAPDLKQKQSGKSCQSQLVLALEFKVPCQAVTYNLLV